VRIGQIGGKKKRGRTVKKAGFKATHAGLGVRRREERGSDARGNLKSKSERLMSLVGGAVKDTEYMGRGNERPFLPAGSCRKGPLAERGRGDEFKGKIQTD